MAEASSSLLHQWTPDTGLVNVCDWSCAACIYTPRLFPLRLILCMIIVDVIQCHGRCRSSFCLWKPRTHTDHCLSSVVAEALGHHGSSARGRPALAQLLHLPRQTTREQDQPRRHCRKPRHVNDAWRAGQHLPGRRARDARQHQQLSSVLGLLLCLDGRGDRREDHAALVPRQRRRWCYTREPVCLAGDHPTWPPRQLRSNNFL